MNLDACRCTKWSPFALLDFTGADSHTWVMTTTQVKQQIDAMSEEDRFFAAAYLQHLANRDNPEHIAQLTEANKRMDAGHKVAFEELVAMHEALLAEGK